MSTSGTGLARLPVFPLVQAESLGLEPKKLLEEAKMTREDLRDPDARIQLRKSLGLWRAVFDAIDDFDLGLRLGAALTVKDAGLVGYSMMHSRNLGDALRRLADFDLAATLTVLREIIGLELAPLAVEFPYREPSENLDSHRSFFGSSLSFDQPLTCLTFTSENLKLPVKTAGETLGKYLDQLAEEVLEDLVPGGSLSEKVERTLWAQIKEGRPQLDSVASALAMSPRTMQRRLREEGTSFVALLDRFRHEFSLRLLEDRELAIYEVAYLLGYSEPSTFYRAFRRWTELSPQEYRASKENR